MDKKKIVTLVAGVVAFAISFVIFSGLFSGVDPVEKQLQMISKEINSTCPITVDSYTILSKTLVLKPRTLRYVYTVSLPEGMGVSELKNLVPTVVQFVKTTPDMEELRKLKVLFSYYYKDKDGKYLYDFDVTPADYEE